MPYKIGLIILTASLFIVSGLSAQPTEVLAEVDATTYGVVCDGTTNDTPNIQAALNAAKKVVLPEGVCIIDAVPTTVDGLIFNDNNVLEGQGKSTVLTKAPGAIVHPIGIYNVHNTEVRDLAIIGDFATSTGGHGIRGVDVDGFIADNIYIQEVNYGIAFAAGTNENISVNNIQLKNLGGDCIDFKNPNNNNHGIFITNIICDNPGSAGIDIRGVANVNGVQILNLDDDGVGIRFRESGVASVGLGAHGSSVTNFYVEGVGTSATIGVSIPGSYASVSNGYVIGTLYGVQIGAPYVVVTNVLVRNTTSHGFVIDEPSSYVSLTNSGSRNAAGYGFVIRGDKVTLSSVFANGADLGAGYISSTADMTSVSGSIFSSNGAAWTKLGTNLVSSANIGF